MYKPTKTGFRITSGKGFQMTFANGYTISVQFGYGNYCDNCDEAPPTAFEYQQHNAMLGELGSNTAELAVWDSNGEWVQMDEDQDVLGYVTPNYVAEIIAKVSSWPAISA